MTTNDNSTSLPWLKAQGTDTAIEHDDSNAASVHDEAEAIEPAADAEAKAESGVHDSASEDEQSSGIFPPVPDSIEQAPFPPGPQFEPEQHQFGSEQQQFGAGHQQFGPEQHQHFGQEPHQFGPEQHFGQEPHQFGPEQHFGQEPQGPFAPPGGPPPMGGFAPPGPYAPQGPGQYPPNPGFAPPGGFPMPEHGGPFAPPGGPGESASFAPPNFGEMPPQQQRFGEMPPPQQHFGEMPPQQHFGEAPPPQQHFGEMPPQQQHFGEMPPQQQHFGEMPPQQQHFGEAPPPNFGEAPQPNFGEAPANYGEARQETPYGEVRQEIGGDGMVRRVFNDDPQGPPPGPEPQQYGQEQFSWAPPPLPAPSQQQAFQQHQPPPPQQQGPGGWQGGPPNQPNPPQQHLSQQAFQPQYMQEVGPPGHSVSDLNLLKRARRSPRGGWRRAVHKMSGGAINPGESSADIVQRELVERVNQPVRGDYRIAILSLKGGVGKTTTTVGLGSTFASVRGDRVIAIDANPDLGTLAHRVPRQTRSTVRNLLEDQHIGRYSDVRAHTSQAPSRLEVLASEQDPAVSEAFSEADYRRAIGILQQFYNIILTDCGTGLMHSAMAGVLDMASSLILVTSPAIDGARSASATLDWLEHHGYNKLVERTVVVVNASRRGASTVDLDQLRKLFLDRTRAVQVVPFDDHLAEGAEIDLELVSKPTRTALLELGAMVADDFGYNLPQPPLPNSQPQYPGPQGGPRGPGPQGPYPGPPTGQYGIPDQYPGL